MPPETAPHLQGDVIIGTSMAIQRTKRLLDKAAPFGESVLLLDEPGTGKEFLACYPHLQGATPKGPFVAINCRALQDGPSGAQDGGSTLETLEIELLRTALIEADRNVSEAARKLGLSRPKLDYRIKEFGLARSLA